MCFVHFLFQTLGVHLFSFFIFFFSLSIYGCKENYSYLTQSYLYLKKTREKIFTDYLIPVDISTVFDEFKTHQKSYSYIIHIKPVIFVWLSSGPKFFKKEAASVLSAEGTTFEAKNFRLINTRFQLNLIFCRTYIYCN